MKPGKEQESYSVISPVTGEEVSRYPLMGREEVAASVERARNAFPAWSRTDFKTRSSIFRGAAALIAERAPELAERISRENGKTRFDAFLADLFPTADLMKFYAKRGEKFLRPVRVSGNPLLPGRKAYYIFEPKGVVGVISPWNYPLTLSAGPAVSALYAGNTVVLKPSSQTTDAGLMLKEVLVSAGLPEDALQVVTGNGSITGRALIEHDGLDMLFFTGSTAVGREVNIKAAQRLIPAIMELGGKDVAIVTKQADLDRAASAVAWGAFTNCGQTCIGTELILVDRAVYEPFLKKLKKIVAELRPGMNAGEIGAMTMESQLRIVEEQLEDAIQKGAKVETGGSRLPGMKGLFFKPTLLTETTPEMKVRKEETFGPLKPVIPYDTIEEALEIANSTEYGLSAAVFSRDLREARRIAEGLKTGSVNINDVLVTYAIPSLPFGGVKSSGVGRYHGREGLRAFTNIKSITEFSWPLRRELYYFPVPEGSEEIAEKALAVFFSQGFKKRASAFMGLIKAAGAIARKSRKRG